MQWCSRRVAHRRRRAPMWKRRRGGSRHDRLPQRRCSSSPSTRIMMSPVPPHHPTSPAPAAKVILRRALPAMAQCDDKSPPSLTFLTRVSFRTSTWLYCV
jgi:hypothetical protein